MKKIFSALVCVIFIFLFFPGDASAAMKDADFFQLCRSGTVQEIRLAIIRGANIYAREELGWTPLMFAAFDNADPEIISVFFRNGADMNAKSASGITPLMAAARFNANPEVVSALLKNGADARIEDNEGRKAIDHASENIYIRGTKAYWELRNAGY